MSKKYLIWVTPTQGKYVMADKVERKEDRVVFYVLQGNDYFPRKEFIGKNLIYHEVKE